MEYRISLKAGSDPVLRVSSSTFLHSHCYRASLWFPEPQHPLHSHRPLKDSFIIGASPKSQTLSTKSKTTYNAGTKMSAGQMLPRL